MSSKLLITIISLIILQPASSDTLISKATNATVLIRNHLIFGLSEDDAYESRGTGSGFLVDKKRGLIMTNAHVSGHGYSKNRLRFEGQSEFVKAEKEYVDAFHDIAILKVPTNTIPSNAEASELDCNYTMTRGDRIFTVGHPNDHLFTVTEGIISGVREMNIDGTFYTSDQVIEPGSSGSAAVNINSGKVIGIATAHATDSDLSMLTRSSKACQILELVKNNVNPARPKLGFQFFLDQGKLSNIVSDVFIPNHPLKKHDVITRINGEIWDIASSDDLADNLRGIKSNEIDVTILRQNKTMSLIIPIQHGQSEHLRDWIHFSGMVFTTPLQQDANQRIDVYPNNVIKLVQFERNYDDTVNAEYQVLSSLLSIDKIRLTSISQAAKILQEAEKDSRKVTLELRGYDLTTDAYRYSYLRTVTIEDLKSNLF